MIATASVKFKEGSNRRVPINEPNINGETQFIWKLPDSGELITFYDARWIWRVAVNDFYDTSKIACRVLIIEYE
jgi:hypothetical protein